MSSYTNYGASDTRDPKVVSTGPVSMDRPEVHSASGNYTYGGREEGRNYEQPRYDQQSSGYTSGQPQVQGGTFYAVPVATTTTATTGQQGYQTGSGHEHGHHQKEEKPGLGERIKVAFGMTPEQKELKREHKEENKMLKQEHKEEKQMMKQELTEEQKREAQYRSHEGHGQQGYVQQSQPVAYAAVPVQQGATTVVRPTDTTTDRINHY